MLLPTPIAIADLKKFSEKKLCPGLKYNNHTALIKCGDFL